MVTLVMYIREDILKHKQKIAMIIELNHGVARFGYDVIKDICNDYRTEP